MCDLFNVLFRVSIVGLSADTSYTITVYTEIDDVIVSGVDLTARTLPKPSGYLILLIGKCIVLFNNVKSLNKLASHQSLLVLQKSESVIFQII